MKCTYRISENTPCLSGPWKHTQDEMHLTKNRAYARLYIHPIVSVKSSPSARRTHNLPGPICTCIPCIHRRYATDCIWIIHWKVCASHHLPCLSRCNLYDTGFFYTLQVYSNTKVDASKTKNMTVTTWPEFMYSEGKLYNCVRKNINIQNFLNHKLLLATWTVIPPSTKLIRQEVGLQRKNIYIMTIPSRSTIKIK